MTREPELYNQLFQRNIKGQAGIKLPKFHIPIGNYKKQVKHNFIRMIRHFIINHFIQIVFASVV